jgi:hypothetical protein
MALKSRVCCCLHLHYDMGVQLLHQRDKMNEPSADQAKYAPTDQQEDIDDLQLRGDWFHGAVLWSTDWTTETILAQLRRGNIDLNPRYQRRAAWDDRRKSAFIESLILGLPIPQIILAEDRRKKGSFLVIDGKQRLLALSQFTSQEKFDALSLRGLTDRPDLIGKKYNDLLSDPTFSQELNTFDNQPIRTVVIRNWQDERYLYSVFLRINTGSQPLSPQELRQAIAPGPFSDFLDEFSINSQEIQRALGLTKPDFRMRDTELVLRFLAYKNDVDRYTGNLKQFLDQFTISTNRDWAKVASRIERQSVGLNEAMAITREIFGEDAYLRKWNGSNYEPRINRAVFDIMTYYLSETDVAKKAVQKKKEIKGAFQAACEDDPEFRASLELTTKSSSANAARFGIWADILERELEIKLPHKPFRQ